MYQFFLKPDKFELEAETPRQKEKNIVPQIRGNLSEHWKMYSRLATQNEHETIWITPGLAEEDNPLFNTYFVDCFDCHFYNDKFAKSTNSTFVRARLS